MPALCSMILMTNYAQNYACIKFACLRERGRMEGGGVRGRGSERDGGRKRVKGGSGRKRGGGRGGGRGGERERERGRRKVEKKNPNGGDQ